MCPRPYSSLSHACTHVSLWQFLSMDVQTLTDSLFCPLLNPSCCRCLWEQGMRRRDKWSKDEDWRGRDWAWGEQQTGNETRGMDLGGFGDRSWDGARWIRRCGCTQRCRKKWEVTPRWRGRIKDSARWRGMTVLLSCIGWWKWKNLEYDECNRKMWSLEVQQQITQWYCSKVNGNFKL